MSSNNSQDYLVIGRITKAHGLDGTVSVFPLTDDPKRFKQLKRCFLLDSKFSNQELKVVRTSVSGTRVLIRLDECRDRDAAEALRDQHIYVPREDAIDLPEDSWFICDLVDCSVQDSDLGHIGKVVDVLTNGPQSTLVIRQSGTKDLLLPLRKEFVPVVNVKEKLIGCNLPAGLYEIYRDK